MPNPISGSVSIRCKTSGCPGGYAGNFVFDLEKWRKDFNHPEIKCETCKQTYTYSADDITLTPAKIPLETAPAEKTPKENPSNPLEE